MNTKKILSALVAGTMALSAMSFTAMAAEATVSSPTGTITPGYTITSNETSSNRIWGDATANAIESFVVELYAEDTKIATTTLSDSYNYLLDGDVELTWSFYAGETTDDAWVTTWESGNPVADVVPTKVVLYVDGTAVADNVVKMTSPDDLNELPWADVEGVVSVASVGDEKYGTLEAAFAAVDEAGVAGKTIELLADVTLTEGVEIMNSTVLSGVKLDGNNHTITLDMNGSGTGIRFGGEWATGVEVCDLTITGSANYALWFNGGTSSVITNLTLTGDYNDVYGGLILYGTHGATLTDCKIVSGFTNGQDDFPVKLVNTKIGYLLANSNVTGEGAKVFIDENSSIDTVYCGGDSTVMLDSESIARIGSITLEATEAAPVAEVGGVKYATLAAAVAAANAGDTVTVIADIADEAVTVEKSITITGTATANNVSITGGSGVDLTVSGLTFTGNSWINSGSAASLTVSGVTANVTPSNTTATNSRSAFIALGSSEQNKLELTVENCNIVVSGGGDPILGWAAITKATITGNTFGSAEAYQTNSDSAKFMSIADGAVFTITGNTVYSNYNGFVFGQNTTRDNAYSVNLSDNDFYGSADHVWVEVSGATTAHATINASSDNTVNGEAFTASDIKAASGITTWTSYAGVDVVTDADGKVIGGTLAFYAEDAIADGFTAEENADGTFGVVAETPASSADLTYGIYVADPSGEFGTPSYRENMQVDLYNVNATNSLVVKLYSGETLLSTTSLRESDRDDETAKLFPVSGATTANIIVKGRFAGSWDTEWHVNPNAELIPDKIEVYADGVLADTWNGGFTTAAEQAEYVALTGVTSYENTYIGKFLGDETENQTKATAFTTTVKAGLNTINNVTWEYNGNAVTYDETVITGGSKVVFGVIVNGIYEDAMPAVNVTLN